MPEGSRGSGALHASAWSLRWLKNLCQLWTAYIWLCIYTVNEVNLWRSPQHAAFDAANSSLLSATSQQLCQRAVEDLERCMPRPGLCGGSNVSIYCQLWTAYIWLCIYTVNEVNLWRSPQHAAFDAANSSLLSATSQQLCQRAVEDLERCMPRPGLCGGSNVSIYCQLWTAYIWLCIYTVNEVNLWRSPQHAAFDAANSSLLSATSQQLCQRAVEDLERCMPRPGLCGGSNVSIYCQLWTAYIWLCIYTVNEVNLWRSPQHAAFDAANSSLLSATSQQLCQRAVEDLERCMPRPGLCGGSNVSIYCQLWTAYIWLCIYTVNEVNLWRSPQHAAFDAANSSLLSATSQQLCQRAVEDLERCMPRPGLCGGSNVSIYCQLWTAYIWLCIYTVNEVNLWRSPQHAAFDAANSSLLSATSQQLCQRAVEDLERCMPRPGLCGGSNVSIYCQLWTAYIWLCIYTVNEVNLWRSPQHAAFDAANSSLLSATSQQLCQRAVEDLERCMPRPGLCGGSNVSIYCQLWTAYIWLCIYTVNEVNLWRSPQHAAFDAANSSLLSATSQQLCQRAVEDLERCMPRPGLCGGSNVSIYCQLWTAYIWLCIYTVNEVKIWRSPQHAAFDAANSSLLSALPNSCARGQSRIWSAACLGLVSAVAQM